MFHYAPNFDEYAPIHAILTDTEVPPDARINLLDHCMYGIGSVSKVLTAMAAWTIWSIRARSLSIVAARSSHLPDHHFRMHHLDHLKLNQRPHHGYILPRYNDPDFAGLPARYPTPPYAVDQRQYFCGEKT